MAKIAEITKNAQDIADKAQQLADNLAKMHNETPAVTGGVDPTFFAFTIFIMACIIGYYVVWKVTPALHTPLMSVTNAISSIIIIGAIISLTPKTFSAATSLGFLACFIAAINIFGGFTVTWRMLAMFKKNK